MKGQKTMTLQTINTREMRNEYAEAADVVRDAVDEAFNLVSGELRARGFAADSADGAEELVAAIYHYVKRSNPHLITKEDEELEKADARFWSQ